MLDLNLIRVFVAVMEEGTLTAAAEKLSLTQPSITHAVNRLRRATGDELFARSGRGVRPTRAARQLYAEVASLPAAADAAVAGLTDFTPARATTTFRIALTDLGQLVFLPRLVPALAATAPRCSLDVVPLDTNSAAEDLVSGALDLAIASTPPAGNVRALPLRRDRYVCVARTGRLGPEAPTAAELSGAARVVIRGSTGHTLVESRMPTPAAGSVAVSTFSTIPALVAGTDLLAFVPQILLPEWLRTWDLSEWPLPFEDTDVTVHAYTAPYALTAATAWFVPWVVDLLRDL
ncbi:LysR family transcriptional regulator [Microbacterium sp. A93]|uniref:LysR family transcriptional regulator n=1 Tax=Microbacterium sp. A93 TaxID=3450716 RepID=UPI003F425D1E